jgi:glycosyltransferase involved in cell wall biosynthesis
MKLSVVLVTMNEERCVRTCLESFAWADELIVIDSGSTDRTVEICREFTDKILITDWPGPGAQRNRAIDMATGDWILAIDADEWVTPELKAEIQAVLSDPGDNVAFEMPRLSSYCGRYMRHSGWWPDRVVRLFKRGYARFSDDLIHQHLIVRGGTGRLKNHLMHESFTDMEEVLGKINRYSTGVAHQMFMNGQRASLWTAIFHGLWSFLHTYVIRAGFLDGREGFMLAVSNAEGTYYKYVKLMLLEKNGESLGR